MLVDSKAVAEVWNIYEWLQTGAASVYAHKVISTDQKGDVPKLQ
jgi:hypothetical protein